MIRLIKRLIKRIYLYFEGREIWNAKMSEPLHPMIISEPESNKDKKIRHH